MNKKNILILIASLTIASFGYILASEDDDETLPSCEFYVSDCGTYGIRAEEDYDGVQVYGRCFEAADPSSVQEALSDDYYIEAIASEDDCGQRFIGHDPDSDLLDYFVDEGCGGIVPDFRCEPHEEPGE